MAIMAYVCMYVCNMCMYVYVICIVCMYVCMYMYGVIMVMYNISGNDDVWPAGMAILMLMYVIMAIYY
jgi:hypothetical protein